MAQLKPISFDASALTQLRSAVVKQVENTGFEPSNDPLNYPIWRSPAEGRFIMYVPNHATLNPVTNERELNEDLVALHRVNDGSRYGVDYRCIQGIVIPEYGLDGNCPLCDGAQESHDWYDAKLALLARNQGTTVEALKSSDEKAVKAIRQGLLDEKKVGFASSRTPRHVFPIVAIPLDVSNQLNLAEAKAFWFDMSSTQFGKFTKSVESTLSADKCLAGHAFLVDYNYDHNGQPTARDAARFMTVAVKDDHEAINSKKHDWDELTKEWTPIKAMEMVKRSAFYPKDALAEKIAPLLAMQNADLQNMLAAMNQGSAPAGVPVSTQPAPLPASAPIGVDISANPQPAPMSIQGTPDTVVAEVVEDSKPSANDVNALMGGGFIVAG